MLRIKAPRFLAKCALLGNNLGFFNVNRNIVHTDRRTIGSCKITSSKMENTKYL